jgi:hypothetical protein
MEGFDYTLIEKDEHNFEICKNRLGLD